MTKLHDSGTNWGQKSVDALKRHTSETFILEVFDSRNTSLERRYSGRTVGASKHAKELSIRYDVHKVIIYNESKGWEEFEKGKLTSWSYPNGLGQIKINS